MRCAVLLLLALSACGASWTSADQSSTSDAVQLNLMADKLLDGGAARAYERAAFCTESATLFRHGGSAPDSGIHCGAP